MKKFVSLLLSLVMVFSAFPITGFSSVKAAGDAEADLNAIINHYSGHGAANPLDVPYGNGEGQFTNSKEFLRAGAAKLVGREPSEIEVSGNFKTVAGTVAGDSPIEYKISDEDGNLKSSYNPEGKKPGIITLGFKIGALSKSITGVTYLRVPAKTLNKQEKVDLEAKAIDWDYYKGLNKSMDYFTSPLKKNQGWGSMHDKPILYKGSDGVELTYSLKYLGEGEDPGALKENSQYNGYNFKVNRAVLNREPAKYEFKAQVKSKEDENVKKDVVWNLTVPPLIRETRVLKVVPEDAEVEIIDPLTTKPLDSSRITRDGGTLTLDLHRNFEDNPATFKTKVFKKGFYTKNLEIITNGKTDPISVSLESDNPNDSKLKDWSLDQPVPGAGSIKKPMEEFSTDKLDYTLEVGAIKGIKLVAQPMVEGAKANVSFYYSEEDADNDELTEKKISNMSSPVYCYLSKTKDTVIKYTIEGPDGSSTPPTTYTLTVKRDADLKDPIIESEVKSTYEKGGSKNFVDITPEERMIPSMDGGGVAAGYKAYVNHMAKDVSVTLKASDETQIDKVQVGDQELEMTSTYGRKNYKYTFTPVEGNNNFKAVVTAGGKTYEYNINVIKKKNFAPTDIEVKDGQVFIPLDQWTARIAIPQEAETGYIKLNASKGSKIFLKDSNDKYDPEQWIPISMKKDGELINMDAKEVFVEKDGEYLRYIIGVRRLSKKAPEKIEHYVPAPGQFVNQDSYKNPGVTLEGTSGGGMVTLGGYGGSVVYKFKEPLKEDAKKPYGIDFIVFGNAFKGNSEPAAVMVSENGKKWYELAGSRYYDTDVVHNIKMEYENGDPTFQSNANIKWKCSSGESGVISGNSYHSQPYYPMPSIYDKYNKGVGRIPLTAEKATFFGGSRIKTDGAPRYGYGDSHPNGNGTAAANPYSKDDYEAPVGDGMDLSWAVDEDGRPVNVSKKAFKYVKVYNVVQIIRPPFGEVSPEISGIVRADSVNEDVGVSEGLTKLTLNGEEIKLTPGKTKYKFDLKGSTKLQVNAEAAAGTNILLGDTYLKSGNTKTLENLGKAIRIVAQDGTKAPKIYYIEFGEVISDDVNTDIEKIFIEPSSVEADKKDDGSYIAEIMNLVKAVRVSAVPSIDGAKVKIDGQEVSADNDWLTPKSIVFDGSEKVVKVEVTSKDGSKVQSYDVKLVRTPPIPEGQTFKVKFKAIAEGENQDVIESAEYEVPKESTLKDLTDRVLIEKDMKMSTSPDGNSLVGIGEWEPKDPNGKDGWVAFVNKQLNKKPYSEIELQANDNIILNYAKDAENPEPIKEKVKVKYRFVGLPEGMSLPAEVEALLPQETIAVEGSTVKPAELANKEVKVSGGTWKFESWNPAEIVAGTEDITFVGNWKFEKETVKPKTWNMGTYIYHAGKKAELRTPRGENRKLLSWKSYNVKLAKVDKKGVVTLVYPGMTKVKATYKHKTFVYTIKIRPKAVSKFAGKKKGRYAVLSWKPSKGMSGVYIYKAEKKKGKYVFKLWIKIKDKKKASAKFYMSKGKRYGFYVKAYTRIGKYDYVSLKTRNLYFK